MDLDSQLFQIGLKMGKSRTGQPVWLNLLSALNDTLEETSSEDIARLQRRLPDAAKDLTERNRALPALRERQRELRTLVDLYVEGKRPAVVVERLQKVLDQACCVPWLDPLPGVKDN